MSDEPKPAEPVPNLGADAFKNRGGRPSKGLSEASQLIRCPRSLIDEVNEAAKAENISASEWWRQAALAKLGKTEP